MKQYTDLLARILAKGRLKENRTGVDTISLLGPQMEFDMADGYPLLGLRDIPFKHAVNENIWFLDGKCNNEDLVAAGTKFWSKWALEGDFVVEEMRPVHAVVQEYIQVRLAEDNIQVADEMPPEELRDLHQRYVQELQDADDLDSDAGKPTIKDPKDAKSHKDLEGGFALIRRYPQIKFTDDRVLATKGYLGPIYGVLWRNWIGADGRSYDQISEMINKLRSDNPKLRYSRCNIVTAFQPSVLPDETRSPRDNILNGKQALAACHTFFQLFAEPLTQQERIDLLTAKIASGNFQNTGDTEDMDQHLDDQGIPRDQLSLKLYQRSADFPVGVPFNIAGYSLLLLMLAKQTNMKPAKFIHTFGDAHIYVNQVDGVKELLSRVEAYEQSGEPLPTLEIADGVESIFDYRPEHFTLTGYAPIEPQIKFEVAV